MSSSFFAFIARMKYINRWALMRNTFDDNLSSHSFEVAAAAHMLSLIGNNRFGKNYNSDRAAVLGLYHDMPEILTGDMPTPVKYYNSEIIKAYEQVEKAACERLISSLPEELKSDLSGYLKKNYDDEQLYAIVKAADKICAYIKCLEERKAGNSEFVKAEETILNSINNMNLPEAKVFLEEFIPAFELTLDQLSDK